MGEGAFADRAIAAGRSQIPNPADVAQRTQEVQAAQLGAYKQRVAEAERAIAEGRSQLANPADIAQRTQQMHSAQLDAYKTRIAEAEASIQKGRALRNPPSNLLPEPLPGTNQLPKNYNPSPYRPDTRPQNSAIARAAGITAAARANAVAAGRIGLRGVSGELIGALGGPIGVAATAAPIIHDAVNSAFDKNFPSFAPYRKQLEAVGALAGANPLGMQEIANSPLNPLNPFGRWWDWAPWNDRKNPNNLAPGADTKDFLPDGTGLVPILNPPTTPVQFYVSSTTKVFYQETNGSTHATREITLTNGGIGIPSGFKLSKQSYYTTTIQFLFTDINGQLQTIALTSFRPKETISQGQSGEYGEPANFNFDAPAAPQTHPKETVEPPNLSDTPPVPKDDPNKDPDDSQQYEPQNRPEYPLQQKADPAPRPTASPTPNPTRNPDPAFRSPATAPRPASAPRTQPAPAPAPAPGNSPAPSPGNSPFPDGFPRSKPGRAPSPAPLPPTSANPNSQYQFELTPFKPATQAINNTKPTPDTSFAPQPQPQPAPPKPAPAEDLCKDPCIADMHDTSQGQKPKEIEYKVFTKCGDKGPEFETKKMNVPANEADALKILLDDAADRKAEKCSVVEAGTLTQPEWWAVRPGADRPQFVILYAEVFSTGKLGGSRWQLAIPHYNRPKGAKPQIPKYRKGNWMGTLTFTDNSKIRINASSASECKRVLNKLKILIPVDKRTVNGKAIKATILERPDGQMKECDVLPIRGDYYSTGQRKNQPDWSVDFRKGV
jgi:hypothetical protein